MRASRAPSADAGLIFVGPMPEAIELMGDKVRARDFVASAWLPVAPSAIEDDDLDDLRASAAAVGFPLLIKPAAGGGGKGMSIVRSARNCSTSEIASPPAKARRYFGDGRVYVER